MSQNLENILRSFEPITLNEMDSVKLMDRTDTKFVFPLSILPKVLQEILPSYRLLEIDNIRCHRYESLYFDSADFMLYHQHHNGKLNRYKLRFRRYADSGGLTFFEVKFKDNQERTRKKRTQVEEIPAAISGDAEAFLKKRTPYTAGIFSPKIWVYYRRMTFVNKFSPERLTVDVDLSYGSPGSEKNFLSASFPQLVIAEAKRDKAAMISPFMRALRQNAVREGALSKYCLGIASLYEEVRKNSFKERIRYIHKTINAQLNIAG